MIANRNHARTIFVYFIERQPIRLHESHLTGFLPLGGHLCNPIGDNGLERNSEAKNGLT